jgi:hypothetical protein
MRSNYENIGAPGTGLFRSGPKSEMRHHRHILPAGSGFAPHQSARANTSQAFWFQSRLPTLEQSTSTSKSPSAYSHQHSLSLSTTPKHRPGMTDSPRLSLPIDPEERPIESSLLQIRSKLELLKADKSNYVKSEDVMQLYEEVIVQVNALNKLRENKRDEQNRGMHHFR